MQCSLTLSASYDSVPANSNFTQFAMTVAVCANLQTHIINHVSINPFVLFNNNKGKNNTIKSHSKCREFLHKSLQVSYIKKRVEHIVCMSRKKKHDSIQAEKESQYDPELERLLGLIPEGMRANIISHREFEQLIEIVMDLGRPPLARFPSGDFRISNDLVTFRHLDQAVSMVGDFADDNRAGIDRSLHRISAIRNRRGRIVGLTCRVGRAVSGSADMVRDLIEGGGSVLIIGPPGVGKTTVIRDIARMLADEYRKRVVVVDTSNEIAGDGDIPHTGIGGARRMQVPNVDLQHKVMIEAVENHMPQTIVIDEIGTELEALAASTISQRGIQLVGTAHGITIENLIKNPSLEILVGGIQTVTLGDEEALRRGVQKTILERKGPPTFTCAVEMISKVEWRVHSSLEATVDALLAGKPALFEIRRMVENEEMNKSSNPNSEINSLNKYFQLYDEEIAREKAEQESDDDDSYISSFQNKFRQCERESKSFVHLYTYEVMEDDVKQVLEAMGLDSTVHLTNDIAVADAVLAVHSKIKQNIWIREMAKFRQIPIFVTKANTKAQLIRAIRTILGMHSFGANSSFSYTYKKPVQNDDDCTEKQNSSDEADALEEARLAIEQIVIPKGQPVELLPRTSELVSLQVKLAGQYKLDTENVGAKSNQRLRILPLQAVVKENITSNPNEMTDEFHDSSETNDDEITGGTTFERLPLLPE